jgi:hypothetical protein
MTISRSSAAALRPTVDEWGVYDPQQAGLAALYTRLAAAVPTGSACAAEPAIGPQAPQPDDPQMKPAFR